LIVPDLGNRSGESALLTGRFRKAGWGAVSGKDKAMRQPFQPPSRIWRSTTWRRTWRSGRGEKVWLLMLIEAMEDGSRPDEACIVLPVRRLSFQPAELEHDPEKHALGRDPGVETGFPRDKRGRVCAQIMLKQRDEIMTRFRLIAS
jgi:hypothetical protein